MRIDSVCISDHAFARWNERIAVSSVETCEDIISALKQARLIKKNEPLPSMIVRIEGKLYALKDDILFILSAKSLHNYDLITVFLTGKAGRCSISNNNNENRKRAKFKKTTKTNHLHEVSNNKKSIKISRNHLEKQISSIPKKYNQRKILLSILTEIDEGMLEKSERVKPSTKINGSEIFARLQAEKHKQIKK